MSHFPARVARRALRLLPEPWQQRIRASRSGRSYPLNTRGLEANRAMIEWHATHGRPVSIVIPSYNDVELLREALRSIEETCVNVDYEVIIVDDYIDAAVQARLREFESPRVRVVLKDERLGFAGTVNIGMKLAAHDIVLLNSDIIAKPGWLEALQYSAYAVHPRIGMVSPKLVYPDGRIQYAGTYYARLLAPQWFGHLHVGSPATKLTANVAGYNASISGACVYITRAAFDTVGPLDDGFWLGFEDVDLGLRAWKRGVRCYYQPAAMLVHYESASRGYSQGQRELASMRRFWRRWESQSLARTISDDAPVTFVIGEDADPQWREYAGALSDAIAQTGRDAEVRVIAASAEDDIVDGLAERRGIAVACDSASARAVWLAGTAGSLPVYLLPAVESIWHPGDSARQSEIIAGYRSEFDYIAPNRWTARQLQAETAWEARRRVAPAVLPSPLPESTSSCVMSIGADIATRAAIEEVCHATGFVASHYENTPLRDEIADARPRAVVDLREHQSSLVPFALMSVGAVYLARSDPRLAHEVLDGYNALLHASGDVHQLASSLTDALTDPVVHDELRSNGHASASRAAIAAAHGVVDALLDFSRAPV